MPLTPGCRNSKVQVQDVVIAPLSITAFSLLGISSYKSLITSWSRAHQAVSMHSAAVRKQLLRTRTGMGPESLRRFITVFAHTAFSFRSWGSCTCAAPSPHLRTVSSRPSCGVQVTPSLEWWEQARACVSLDTGCLVLRAQPTSQ